MIESDGSVRVFGQGVAQLRNLQGMTVAELSERSGLDEATITELEAGERLPELDELNALSAGLGVRASAIVRVWENGRADRLPH